MGTHAEVRKEYCQKMGEELGTAYHLLWNECAHLHMCWDEYVEMFGKSQQEIDTMNGIAPGFFKSVQDMSWESILLYLCRFTDPEKSRGRRTLSLNTLLKMIEAQKVPELDKLVAEASLKCAFARDWRNRYIAHTDFEHAQDKTAVPLAPATRNSIRESLAAIVAVLEAIEGHFTGSCLGFGGPRWNWGGTRLLSELRLVGLLRQERDQRLESGNATEGDLDFTKWH